MDNLPYLTKYSLSIQNNFVYLQRKTNKTIITMAKEKKLYYVRWFTSGGYNYKDTSNVPWDGVREYKRIAKEMGEKITYEPM